MTNFWQELPRPFTVLAPLDGITDVVFRQTILKIGRPHVFFTEFTSCDGLLSVGRARVEEKLLFTSEEQPIVVQLWGTEPESFKKSAEYVRELGFAGIDINMGCPDRTIIRNGACSALIKNPTLALEIIQATQEGAGGLPVSVKTRIGFSTQQLDEWIGLLLQQKLSALTVHLRTVQEMSKVPAHWEQVPQIIEMRKKYAAQTLIIGNGDITSLCEVDEKYKKYGCEGFMIGRGIFANPWVFNRSRMDEKISMNERIQTYLEQITLFEKTWKGTKNFANLKKFGKAYINNFSDASLYREKMMQSESLKELKELVKRFKNELT